MLASDHSQCRGLLSARQNGSPQPMDNPASCRGTSCHPQVDAALYRGVGGVLESTGQCAKDVKIVETNSTNPFTISKTSKKRTQNELKNDTKTTQQTAKKLQIHPGHGAWSAVAQAIAFWLGFQDGGFAAALQRGLGGVLKSTGRCTKDVKIVGTNSTKPFIISKTSKKRTQNELKNGAKKHATNTQLLPMRRERPSGRECAARGRTRDARLGTCRAPGLCPGPAGVARTVGVVVRSPSRRPIENPRAAKPVVRASHWPYISPQSHDFDAARALLLEACIGSAIWSMMVQGRTRR